MAFFKPQLVAATTGTAEVGGFSIIPHDTTTVSIIVGCEVKTVNTTYANERRIEITWQVTNPAAHAGTKFNQKIRVWDKDPKKQEKAEKMLLAIDKNAGGKLVAANEEPTTENLTRALTNAVMLTKFNVIKSDDGRENNYIASVSPRSTQQPAYAPPAIGDDGVPF